ncbi:MAG: DUF4974 domain-containing protein [Prevotella sp.]|nr:DUF4974 domain-containing protein [Prevotella sp.]
MNINEIIYRKIAGQTSAEEDARLKEWMEASPLHQSQYEQLQNDPDFSANYQIYQRLDVDKAWAKLVENEKTSSEKAEVRGEKLEVRRMRNLLKYAAAILVLIIAGAGYWYSQYTKVTPPEIPEAVQLAMQQSIQSGKQEAEVLGVRGEKIRGERIESGAGKQEQDISLTSHPSPLTPENLSSLTKDQLLAAKRITTKHDKEFWLTLDDGTLVHLNYNTRLIYPEKFGRGDRNVILDGEAYFMVAKDKSRPFIVHTPNGDVKVYGTEFNVNTRTEVRGEHKQDKSLTATTTVVLVKGSVSVIPTGGKETMLKPGQQATVNGQWSTVNVENVDVEPYVAWNEGKFSFRNWQLERIMDVLSRWYGYSVEYRDSSIRQLTFSGNFNRYEKIRPTMDFISEVAGLKIEIKQNKIIIEK